MYIQKKIGLQMHINWKMSSEQYHSKRSIIMNNIIDCFRLRSGDLNSLKDL